MAVVLVGSWVAGAALCVMKGDGGGLLDVLGNLWAPYVIVAVLAGLVTRRWWAGALLGVAATEATVGGFYWAWDALLRHEIAPGSVILWGSAGLASGAVFGIAGRAAATRPALRYLIPALLLLEPVITQAGSLVTTRFGVGDPQLDGLDVAGYAIEVAVGLAALLVVRRHVRGTRSRMQLRGPV